MIGPTAALALLALLARAGAGAGAGTDADDDRFDCIRPLSRDVCARIRIKCRAIDAQRCTDCGGQFLRGGGACGYCDLCAQYVGEGQRCHVASEDLERPTLECEAPLLCSGLNGTCVLEERCKPARSR